jgi:hypothetical protein
MAWTSGTSAAARRAVVQQIVNQDVEGGQGRAQFMRRPGGLTAQGNQPVVADGALAGGGEFLVAAANAGGELQDEPDNHDRRQGEDQPHANQVQGAGHLVVGDVEGDVILPEKGIDEDGG